MALALLGFNSVLLLPATPLFDLLFGGPVPAHRLSCAIDSIPHLRVRVHVWHAELDHALRRSLFGWRRHDLLGHLSGRILRLDNERQQSLLAHLA